MVWRGSTMGTLDRWLRDLTRPWRWAARTGWWLARTTPDPIRALRLFFRLWWAERRHERHGLRMLRLSDQILWVGEFNDLHVTREVFGDQVYDVAIESPRVILDLGANIGASVLWFHRRWPRAEIHAVEPDRRSLDKLRRNAGHIEQVTVHELAVADRDGSAEFWEAERGWSSSLYGDGGTRTEVEVVTLPTLLGRIGVDQVDVLKLDVEGAEWWIFARLRLADLASVVTGEMHEGMFGQPEAERGLWRAGLAGFDLRFERREGSGHFTATQARPATSGSTGRFARPQPVGEQREQHQE
jgi:FkbM family methyltransferase